jgi:hypothetical protein
MGSRAGRCVFAVPDAASDDAFTVAPGLENLVTLRSPIARRRATYRRRERTRSLAGRYHTRVDAKNRRSRYEAQP